VGKADAKNVRKRVLKTRGSLLKLLKLISILIQRNFSNRTAKQYGTVKQQIFSDYYFKRN